MFAGWAWIVRYVIVMLAASPMMIFASQLMHFCTFAFYTPASIDFMSEVLSAIKDKKYKETKTGTVHRQNCSGFL